MADLLYPPVIGAARLWFKALDLRIDLRGSEHLPSSGGAVLTSNHISYLDFIFNGLAARPAKRLVRFMAKESVFRHKVSGPLMRAMKHIPVDRTKGEEAYSEAVAALRRGEIVGVFPEATISRSFTLKDFKTGAARMAQEARVPLVPMAVWGTQRLWTKGHKRDFGRNHLPLTLRVGAPLEPEPGEGSVGITERLKERMQELLETAQRAYPAHESSAGSWWLPAHLGGTAPTPAEARAL